MGELSDKIFENKKMGKESIAFAISLDGIWIPPMGRPFWTAHNAAGNAGPDLTDEELDRKGLSAFKKYPFDEEGAKSHKRRHEAALAKQQHFRHTGLPKNYTPYKSTPWNDEKEKRYQSGLRAIRKMIERYKR